LPNEATGTLTVQTVEAHNLANMDTFSSSDPYVTFWQGMWQHRQTTHIISNNLNPRWHGTPLLSFQKPDRTEPLKVGL
jgi:Ca2+-dependent lipid-binding protein